MTIRLHDTLSGDAGAGRTIEAEAIATVARSGGLR